MPSCRPTGISFSTPSAAAGVVNEAANRQYSWLKLLDTGGLAIIHPQLSWSTRSFLGPPPEDLQYYLPEQD